MKQATLALICRDNRVLLGLKKKAEFGTGTLNGPGGKKESMETLRECMVREAREEVGVAIKEDDLKLVAWLTSFAANLPFMEIFVYRVRTFEGEPRETPYMIPEWFPVDNLPFDRMNESDRHWMPAALLAPHNRKIYASLYYEEPLKGFLRAEMTPP